MCVQNLKTNLANCGACGHACGANQVCTNGACACAAGFEDCLDGPGLKCVVSRPEPFSYYLNNIPVLNNAARVAKIHI